LTASIFACRVALADMEIVRCDLVKAL